MTQTLVKNYKISPREKMKTVMLIWKGLQSIHWASMRHGVPQHVIKKWCQTAMRCAKQGLKYND